MEGNKEPQRAEEANEKIIDGITYHKVFSGYTVREYFSQTTPEKGPGPGWDSRMRALNQYDVDDPSKLPDEPYFVWEEVADAEH